MKIKVLLVMPGKEPKVVKIPANIKFIKAFIGNQLFVMKLDQNTFIFADKNASFDDFNRIYGSNIILGTFLIVSVKNKRKVSMKKKDIRRYINMFKLRKHQKKINTYKEEFLEEYYSKLRKNKQKNAKRNKEEIFKMVA